MYYTSSCRRVSYVINVTRLQPAGRCWIGLGSNPDYQEGKMVDNELLYLQLTQYGHKIHTRWVYYKHSIMGTLCHVLDTDGVKFQWHCWLYV